MNAEAKLAASQDIATKVSVLFRKRAEHARDEFAQRLEKAADDNGVRDPAVGARMWTDWYSYAVDATQRSVLFWDAMRQRGNNFVEHTQAGLPPVLHFDYEMVLDGRGLDRPGGGEAVRGGRVRRLRPDRRDSGGRRSRLRDQGSSRHRSGPGTGGGLGGPPVRLVAVAAA